MSSESQYVTPNETFTQDSDVTYYSQSTSPINKAENLNHSFENVFQPEQTSTQKPKPCTVDVQTESPYFISSEGFGSLDVLVGTPAESNETQNELSENNSIIENDKNKPNDDSDQRNRKYIALVNRHYESNLSNNACTPPSEEAENLNYHPIKRRKLDTKNKLKIVEKESLTTENLKQETLKHTLLNISQVNEEEKKNLVQIQSTNSQKEKQSDQIYENKSKKILNENQIESVQENKENLCKNSIQQESVKETNTKLTQSNINEVNEKERTNLDQIQSTKTHMEKQSDQIYGKILNGNQIESDREIKKHLGKKNVEQENSKQTQSNIREIIDQVKTDLEQVQFKITQIENQRLENKHSESVIEQGSVKTNSAFFRIYLQIAIKIKEKTLINFKLKRRQEFNMPLEVGDLLQLQNLIKKCQSCISNNISDEDIATESETVKFESELYQQIESENDCYTLQIVKKSRLSIKFVRGQECKFILDTGDIFELQKYRKI